MGTSSQDDKPILIRIDGLETAVPKGTTILAAAQQLGVDIPTLCHHPDLRATGSCRVCMVEVCGEASLVTSCDHVISQPLEVNTRGHRVWRARRDAVSAMFLEHYGWPTHGFRYCHTCASDGPCELQRLATEYGITLSPDHPLPARPARVALGEVLEHDLAKCVRCERCTRTCVELQGWGALRMGVGSERSQGEGIAVYPEIGEVPCVNCGQCAARCPTAALRVRDDRREILDALADPNRHVVIQTAPAPRSAIGESFGAPAGTAMTWQLNAALRRLGFDGVFDTCFSADLTIIEEGTELLVRLFKWQEPTGAVAPLPLLSSCCPAWVTYLEQAHPRYLPYLSTCKSPQQMLGALVKTWYAQDRRLDPEKIVSIALMPCVGKKAECRRPEMGDGLHPHIDYVLTTRECGELLREHGIDLPGLAPEPFDEFFAGPSGSGVIFGHSGGVMEAAMRTVMELVAGKSVPEELTRLRLEPVPGFDGCRYGEIQLPTRVAQVPDLLRAHFDDFEWLAGKTLKVAVVQGLAAIQQVMTAIEQGALPFVDCHFIEMMSCPGGCVAGGGQPSPTSPRIRSAREQALRAEDEAYGHRGLARRSYENPAVLRAYREWLTDGPGGAQAHRLLHTVGAPQVKG